MQKIGLSYSLGVDAAGPLIHNPLLDLLQAVHSRGSISGAATALGLSYRHVWGELRRWEQALGRPLLHWEKGRRARLSEFGDKLLRLERQAQIRLAPQIEALRAELERSFALAFNDAAHVLPLYASHDDALLALRQHAAGLPGAARLHLDVRFTGGVDALQALNDRRCLVAGIHARCGPSTSAFTQRAYQPLLQPDLHELIGFAMRKQGLIVAAGNPHNVASLADLSRTGVRFVNRAPGSGTRLLLDELLAEFCIDPARINGYDRVEPSHIAVAQTIAAGRADAGLGIEAAARARGLDFVPLRTENYHFVCLKAALEEPPVAALRAMLSTPAWQRTLAALPGYRPSHSGQVRSLTQVLPWWSLARAKQHPRSEG
ncbi:substrate-binding domain-containing protein [Ottowia testudinis]|uniref:Helix-turn-helix transcriptional regulator n=1 Tax=Ottowia testudinis TaxID=2816950 RepID=A0A975H2T3_9BURK|nr:substrate-binding domain-containing protein [Ottowia testudinis]QTD44536.1 helix-turn-helix transcriptional regulator [Ottowia testudinis]